MGLVLRQDSSSPGFRSKGQAQQAPRVGACKHSASKRAESEGVMQSKRAVAQLLNEQILAEVARCRRKGTQGERAHGEEFLAYRQGEAVTPYRTQVLVVA